jgi:hypothetical protein
MEGFTKLPKMQHFKEGGSVQDMCYGGKAMKKGGHAESKEMNSDLAQDKKLIKKAFKQHDEAEHDKEPTEIKLKKGGRSKKECGTVRKYKTGGSVTNVYQAKKKSGDIDAIEAVKDIKPGKAAAPSRAATKPIFAGSDVEKEKSKPAGHKDPYIKSKESGKKAAAPSGAKGPDAFKKGGKVKKYSGADGSYVKGQGQMSDFERNPAAAQDALDTKENIETRNMIMDPARKAKKYIMDKLSGLGGLPGALKGQGAVSDTERKAATGNIDYKKGGKIKKMNTGGTCS